MGSDLTSSSPDDRILVRGHDVATDLIGKLTFTETMLLNLNGTPPAPSHVRAIDAILVALMEHGVTPSTLTARLVIDAAPEAMQGALAAGLLAAGSRFLGTIEEAARFLCDVVGASEALEDSIRSRVTATRSVGGRLPGFGHNLHKEDPRVAALLRVAEEEAIASVHTAALKVTANILARDDGPAIRPNAAGASAAILCDLGYVPEDVRGFALIARAAGIFAHIVDERRAPIARAIWEEFHVQPLDRVAAETFEDWPNR